MRAEQCETHCLFQSGRLHCLHLRAVSHAEAGQERLDFAVATVYQESNTQQYHFDKPRFHVDQEQALLLRLVRVSVLTPACSSLFQLRLFARGEFYSFFLNTCMHT